MADDVKGAVLDAEGMRERNIRDFGDQWAHHGANDGFYGSLDLLADALGPLLDTSELRGARVADVGSGAGRIVRMLLAAGVDHVIGVEPSQGVEVLAANTKEFGDRVEIVHGPGEALPSGRDLDYVFSIGVVQFIPDPSPVIRAMRAALRPGGRAIVWVYAAEGDAFYLGLLRALRSFTTRLPHPLLSALCSALTLALTVYVWACRWLPLPMHVYARTVLSQLSWQKRKLTIYDQLNPSYVRFYTREEITHLLESGGFVDVRLHDRHGYSWTAIGTRPGADAGGAFGSTP
jgi:SAM-dependent methyltransferase